jgi:hypothetical protein
MVLDKVSSVTEFIETVLSFKQNCYPDDPYPDLWFRGINNDTCQLLPGAYWRKECDEESLVLSFRSMAPAYIEKEPLDDWEWYYLMQHYGLPTRLLDWSESPLYALYFALRIEASGKTPCVWMMDPVALNQAAHGPDYKVITAPIIGSAGTGTEYWLPKYCGRGKPMCTIQPPSVLKDNSMPLALFPKRHNPRIIAQRGVFTIHGSKEIAIEEILQESDSCEDRIAKITVDPGRRSQLLYDLYTLGINRTALFPEPESVAEDLKKIYRVI